MSSDWLHSAFNFTAAPPTERAYTHMLQSDAAADTQAADDARLAAAMAGGRLDTSTLQDLMWTTANFNLMHDGLPLLHHLVLRRDLPALLLVISGSRAGTPFVSAGDTDAEGMTALDYAELHGWEEGAHYLRLYHHDITGEDLNYRERNHRTRMNGVLALAVQKDDVDVVRRALKLGADPNTHARSDLSVLHLACLWLNTDIVDALVAGGADVHAPHARGHTTLQLLWWCNYGLRLSPKWHAMADHLKRLGADATGFKLLEDMSVAELREPPAGSGLPGPAMDLALQAGRMQIYKKALMSYGADRDRPLVARSGILQESPLLLLARGNALHNIFTPEIWQDQPDALLRAWRHVKPELEKPLISIATQRPIARSFTEKDFAHLLVTIAKNGGSRKYSLPRKGRP